MSSTKGNKGNLEIFLKHFNKYKFIAHKLGFIIKGYPENSLKNLEAFLSDEEIFNYCNGIEFDMRFTNDHVPVIVHDFSTTDISKESKNISKSKYDELKDIKCGYRRSSYNSDIPWEENNIFNLYTVESLFKFLNKNRSKFKDFTIKIESKSLFLKKEDLIAFKNLLKKYKNINKNIIHISFFPWNLKSLRVLQKKEGLPLIRTELLLDFYVERIMIDLWAPYIDGVALGIREDKIKGNLKIDKKTQRSSNFYAAFYERRNAVTEALLKKLIKRYGYVGIYTVSNTENAMEFLSRVSEGFLDEFSEKLVITSDNPSYFKEKITVNN